jgi:DNA polymerase alpha subunit B
VRLLDATQAKTPLTRRDLWDVRFLHVLETGMLKLPTTRVVLVPSVSDALGAPVFPQPPLDASLLAAVQSEAVRSRISLVANPSTFSVGGVVFGVVGADPLIDLYTKSLYRGPSASKIKRMAEHLLEQRSYYPLFPAEPSVPLDPSFCAHLNMPCAPDILLLPSRLPPALFGVDHSTLVVMPGSLARHDSGGHYAQLQIRPLTAHDIHYVPTDDTTRMASEEAHLSDAAKAVAKTVDKPLAPHNVRARTYATVIHI